MEQPMLSSIDREFSFLQDAINLRAKRQELLAANIANSDTPHYKAVDIDFAGALRQAMGAREGGVALARTAARHLPASFGGMPHAEVLYRHAEQPSIDGNTVDMDVERGHFADNAIHYQAVITFLNGRISSLLAAAKGQ
jgi:flagellar basal-body rod protein FlgB